MPSGAIALWLITGGLCFVLGTYFLWKIERSGVKRWGACGRLFGLGESGVRPDAEGKSRRGEG
jgi:hypothetical protein